MNHGDLLTVVPYRCVCGNAIALLGDDSRQCLHCQRSVPKSAFHNGDATIIGGGEPDVDLQIEFSDPLLRQRLKHFHVQGALGRGGMGVVYRAVDESLERDVALKVIRTTRQNQSEASLVKRLLVEARAQARITHPNIVQVYYVDAQGETPFLAMELVHGVTFEERLQHGPMEFTEIIDVAVQTSKALRAAAKYDIVHGDIKPANLLISHDGTVKLSDFGLARPVDHLSDELVGISGTPNYLSPEACRGESTQHQSDMYSLGIVLFQATFGRLPYPVAGAPLLTRLRAHLECPVKYPPKWPSDIPLAWKDVLDKLLAKQPEARYGNYDELLAELERMRPVDLPISGRVVRGLAWIMDLSVLLILTHFFRDFSQLVIPYADQGLFAMTVALFMGGMLLLAAVAQAMTGLSPGKHLMQIRLVDDYGLGVQKPTLLARALFQQLPLWGVVGLRLMMAMGMAPLGWTIALVLGAISLIDAAFAFFRPDRRSFHDLLFGTYVVMDTTTKRRSRRSSRPISRRMSKQDDQGTLTAEMEFSTQAPSWTS
ncbi:MAG TPA: protein kinase [Planctomicrobium sp.]|nr:protein kinase [Planctomicrobium sp.]